MTEPASEQFTSPSALREYALETAAALRVLGLSEAGDILESAATFVTSSGWEWLGELGSAAASIRKRFELSESVAARLARIHKTATSRHPYG